MNLEVDDDALDFLVTLADHDASGAKLLEIAANAASRTNKTSVKLPFHCWKK